MSAPDYIDTREGRRLAYHRTAPLGEAAGLPGVVFLGGLASDMTGTKATWLEGWARARGRAFLRIDYSGHGASSGRFDEGSIGEWAEDAEAALTALTEGPQIVVGSSMGGWIGLLLAKRAPERFAAMVGIAAAPDFTEDSMWAEMSGPERERLLRDGRIEKPSDYSDTPYVITRKLIEDGRERLVLRDPLPLPFPVRLLHGSADADVPLAVGLRLMEHAECADLRLQIVKGADHRFSGERELAILGATLEEATQAARA